MFKKTFFFLIISFLTGFPVAVHCQSETGTFWYNGEFILVDDPVPDYQYPAFIDTIAEYGYWITEKFASVFSAAPELPTYEAATREENIPSPVAIPKNWQLLYNAIWTAFYANLKNASETMPARLSAQFKQDNNEASEGNQFFWDQAFINFGFGLYAHNSFNTLGGLDTFYRRQRHDGFFPRELDTEGKEVRFFPSQNIRLRITVDELKPQFQTYSQSELQQQVQTLKTRLEKKRQLVPIQEHLDKLLNQPELHPGLVQQGEQLVNNAENLVKLYGKHNNTNPPLAAHAEWRHYLMTRDKGRLRAVVSPLRGHTEWLEMNRKVAHNDLEGLFWQSPMGSGMDNLPVDHKKSIENKNTEWDHWQNTMGESVKNSDPDYDELLKNKKYASFDMSAQMKLHYDAMVKIEQVLGNEDHGRNYLEKSKALKNKINDCMWDEENKFYFDVMESCSKKNKLFALSGYWALYASIASDEQAEKMLTLLKDKKHFNTTMPFPSLSVSHPDFYKHGNYWRGGVWPPLFYMTVMGLMNYADSVPEAWSIAIDATKKHLSLLAKTMLGNEQPKLQPGQAVPEKYRNRIYEYNSPSTGGPGLRSDTKGKNAEAKSNFVGWGGLPAGLIIQVMAGVNVKENEITWHLYPKRYTLGVRHLNIGSGSVSLTVQPDAKPPFTRKDFDITSVNPGGTGIEEIRIIIPSQDPIVVPMADLEPRDDL